MEHRRSTAALLQSVYDLLIRGAVMQDATARRLTFHVRRLVTAVHDYTSNAIIHSENIILLR